MPHRLGHLPGFPLTQKSLARATHSPDCVLAGVEYPVYFSLFDDEQFFRLYCPSVLRWEERPQRALKTPT